MMVSEVPPSRRKECLSKTGPLFRFQIPLKKKLLIEAVMEAVERRYVKALKDLGGGGLSCCLSELSDTLGKGFDIELSKIHSKEKSLDPASLMVSESQERMLFVTDLEKLKGLRKIFQRNTVLGSV